MVLRVQQDGAERRITVEELEASIRAGSLSPEAPLSINGRWTAARDWPSWEALRATPEAAMRALWARRPVAWVTAITLGILVQVHLFSTAAMAHGHISWIEGLTRDTTGILERGESWRLLTYGLLHSGLEHILGNAAALAVAGMALEKLIGARATLLVLLVTTALGGTLSAIFLPEISSLGISGGDFGLMAACAILGARYAEYIPGNARAALGTVAAVYTLYTFLSTAFQAHVDTWCHLGGLLGGLLVGAMYRPRIPAWERRNRIVDGILAGALVLLLATPFFFGPKLVPWTPWAANGATATRPAWWGYQVTRSGLGGYGNADRSSAISLDTTRYPTVTTPEKVFAAQLKAVQQVDTGATLETLAPDRALIRYNPGAEARVLELRATQRGLYITVAAIDTTANAHFAPELRAHILGELELAPPDSVKDDLEGASSSSWKKQLAAAVATAELGDLTAAAPLFAAARKGGDASAVESAELGVLAALADPSAASRIEAAVAASPDDRRLLSAAARAWALFGDASRAQAQARALWDSAPSDRSRRAAAELIEEVGGVVPPETPVVLDVLPAP